MHPVQTESSLRKRSVGSMRRCRAGAQAHTCLAHPAEHVPRGRAVWVLSEMSVSEMSVGNCRMLSPERRRLEGRRELGSCAR